jgi:hypothetical protein
LVPALRAFGFEVEQCSDDPNNWMVLHPADERIITVSVKDNLLKKPVYRTKLTKYVRSVLDELNEEEED